MIYEVNLTIDQEIAEEFKQWLKDHVAKMLEFKGFEKAEIFSRDPAYRTSPDIGKVFLTVQYTVRDRQSLDNYFQDHAPRMRTEGQERFPGQFSATRRILEVVK